MSMAAVNHVSEKNPINPSQTLKHFKYFNIYKYNFIKIEIMIQPTILLYYTADNWINLLII